MLTVYLPISGWVTQAFPLTINNEILAIFLVSAVLSSLASLSIGLDELGKLPLNKLFNRSQMPSQPEMSMQTRPMRRFAIEEVFQLHASEVPPGEEYISEREGITTPVEETSLQDLFEILDQLKSELKDFEKIREGIGTRISSITKLIPGLDEKKAFLEKAIGELAS